jgi:hypothetical protein
MTGGESDTIAPAMPASRKKPVATPASLSAFGDKTNPPTAAELRSTLGPVAGAWGDLIRHVGLTYPTAVEQWNFAGAKYGWSLRLKKGERVVLYLIPQSGRFLVGIVLGAKTVAAALREELPADVLRSIAEAPRYAEGTGLRLPVEDRAALPAIERLTALKMAT